MNDIEKNIKEVMEDLDRMGIKYTYDDNPSEEKIKEIENRMKRKKEIETRLRKRFFHFHFHNKSET